MSAIAPIDKPEAIGRIWNNSDKEYKEKFRGQLITIPARGFHEMEYYDAVMFFGQYVRPEKDDSGNYINCKPLRLEKIASGSTATSTKFISHADGKVFATAEELDAHLKANADKFIPQKDEELEKALAARNKTDEALGKVMDALSTLATRLDKLEAPKRGKKRDTSGDHNSSETVD